MKQRQKTALLELVHLHHLVKIICKIFDLDANCRLFPLLWNLMVWKKGPQAYEVGLTLQSHPDSCKSSSSWKRNLKTKVLSEESFCFYSKSNIQWQRGWVQKRSLSRALARYTMCTPLYLSAWLKQRADKYQSPFIADNGGEVSKCIFVCLYVCVCMCVSVCVCGLPAPNSYVCWICC